MYSLKLKIISHKKLKDIFIQELLKSKHVKKNKRKNKKIKKNFNFFINNFNVKKKNVFLLF